MKLKTITVISKPKPVPIEHFTQETPKRVEKKKKTLDEIYLNLVQKVSDSQLPEYQRLKIILTAKDHNHQFQRRIILDVLQLLFF